MEEPQLGAHLVGAEACTFSLAWSLELGWSLRSASRLSGSAVWRTRDYPCLSAEEALQLLQDAGAEVLGLV